MALFQYFKKVDGTIQGPSYPRCTSAISCRHEGGQGNVPQDQCWEGWDRTACSRTLSASNGSVLCYEASCTSRKCGNRGPLLQPRMQALISINYWYHVHVYTQPARNSLIVGVACLSSAFAKLLQLNFKNGYLWNFRPAKYKCYMVYLVLGKQASCCHGV